MDAERAVAAPTLEAARRVAKYWTGHTVRAPDFTSAAESLEYLEWRFSEYPQFRELSGLWGDHSGETVLDYGCGPGNDVVGLLLFSGARKVIGMDVSPTSIGRAGARVALHEIEPERVELVRLPADSRAIPLADSSVDHVNCQGVLHHLAEPAGVLREFRRVLAPQGWASVMVYNRDSIWFHLHVAYVLMLRDRVSPGASVDEVFRTSTDGPDCPISHAYRPAEFERLCRDAGFEATFAGGYFHRKELKWLESFREDALASHELADEHKEFIRSLTADEGDLPLHEGRHAGIGGVYRLRPV